MSAPTTATPSIVAIWSRARIEAAIVRDSSASPWTASWRRAASSDAMSSADCDVERTSRTQRPTSSASMRPPAATWSIADCVSEPTILCVEVSTASAPRASALAGSAGWKPKCGPHAWSTTSGTPAAWHTSAQPATSAAMP